MTADDPLDETPEWECLIPFVAVVSKGGPFDDGAYAAGWEMGMLQERVQGFIDAGLEGWQFESTIRAENAGQADLIAMSAGARAEVWKSPDEEPADEGWVIVTLVKVPGADR